MFTFLTKSKLITYLNISWQNSAEIIFISACWSIDGLADFLNMVLPQPVTYPVLSWTSSSLSGKQTGWICFLNVTGRSNLIRAISLLKFFGWKSLFTLISSMSKSSCSKGSFVALAFQSPKDHPYFTSAKDWVDLENGQFCWHSILYFCWYSRAVVSEKERERGLGPISVQTVNPIPTRGIDYAHHIIYRPCEGPA